MENFETYRLDQTGQQTQAILDQVSTNTADIEQLRALYEALTQSEPVIIQPSDTWPVVDPQENVIYRVIDRVNTPPQSYSDYMWNGTAMVLMATYNNAIDNEPTPGSNNFVKSGGVAASIVFDISAYHATGSTLATYSNLAAALGTDGANVPASVRKGGMSVKFVQNNDNKYVQYRLMNQNWSTTITDWQGVDDEPTAGSDNLVKSGGVHDIKTVSLIHSFDEENIITGKYVDSEGHIGSSSQRYRLIKFHLDKGNYRFFNKDWRENFGLWKYSDAEYSQDATKITVASYDEILSLNDGYYILYWYSASSDSTIIPKEFIVYNVDFSSNSIENTCDLITSKGVFDKVTNSAIIDIPAGAYRLNYPIKNGSTYVFYYISGSGSASIYGCILDKTATKLYNSISSSAPKHIFTADNDYVFLQFESNNPLKIGVYKTDSIEGRVFGLEERDSELADDLYELANRVGTILNINETGETPLSWDKQDVYLPKGDYILSVSGSSSFNFKDSNGDSIRSFTASNRTIEFTLNNDAVRVSGYCTETNIDGYLIASIITKDSLTKQLNVIENEFADYSEKTDERISKIDGSELNVHLVPESGSYVGAWDYNKEFLAGTYLVTNKANSYTSLIFYDNNNIELYRNNSLPRNETLVITLASKASKVGGYSSQTDSVIDLHIVAKDSMEDRLESLENGIDISVLNPPTIYDTLIQNNVRSRLIDGSTKKIFSLVHFSDIHGITLNVERIKEFVSRYTGRYDDIICTGDIVSDVYTDDNILNAFPDIISIIGNHDAWIRTYDEDLAEWQQTPNIWVVKRSYCYDKFIADNVDNWGVVQPSDVTTTKKCYFYKDYSQGDSKLRLICLDCMHYNVGADLDENNNSIQNAWLESVLTDAKNNSIPVVIAAHYWPAWVNINDNEVIKCSYTNTDSIASDYLPAIAISSVQDFIDNDGEFVCWITGHAHCDIIAAPRNYPKQMFIAVDCGTYANSIGNSARVKNTKSQDCFNIIAFDTYDKLVKVVRVGSDTTRQLKQKRVLAYRYAPFTDAAGTLHNIGLELSE